MTEDRHVDNQPRQTAPDRGSLQSLMVMLLLSIIALAVVISATLLIV